MNTAYPDSYYWATSTPTHTSTQLPGDLTVDVAIVGGGFTGLSAALELSAGGYSVAVLERHRVGWGASGRNGGQMLFGFAEHEEVEAMLGKQAGELAWRLSLECRDLVKQRIDDLEIDCDLTHGYLHAALNKRQLRSLKHYQEDLSRRGYPAELTALDSQEIRSHVGTDRYVGGLFDPADTHLHPLKLCFGEAIAAERSGVKIFEHTPVIRIDRSGPNLRMMTPNGCVKCDFALLAGNAYLGDLAGELKGHVLPAGSYIIATEPLGETAQSVLPTNAAVCDQNTVLDYYRLSADKRMLFGGRCNYSGREPRSIAAVLQPRMTRLFPQLAGAKVDYQWGGHIAITLNRLPQLGRLQPNLYYAQGYSGHGVAASHLAGKLVAEAISNQAERFDVMARIKHSRLPGGRWFASQALALGMMWYRMRDVVGI